MENELDLTLKLGLPNSTVVETHLSLNTSTTTSTITDQGTTNTNVGDGGREDHNNNNEGSRGGSSNDGGEVFNLRRAVWGDHEVINDQGARSNMDMNIRVYNYIFQQFVGVPNTLNVAVPNTLNVGPYPMTPSPRSTPALAVTPEFVLIDVPSRRASRSNTELMANAWNETPSAHAKRLRGSGGYYSGGRGEGTLRKCTNVNCNALTTPMWRRGPLGPKSLCNACGIKFRKEEERKSKRNRE
ncbi:PREDICTED: GATA transcription factor 29-like [Camelina sativa]|uniref:GATA transcription factor 29-like n=1 Tax=Camelina sativa TaxID=90675 RepID=A0ABM0Z1W5_CAMSA|nr:PREDICTED: GATA transcription factor 29-like [Camelina sativa]